MKKIKPYFLAEVKDGNMTIVKSDQFHKYVETLENKEGITKLKITVEKYRSNRSVNQNNYYWGVVIPILGDWAGVDQYEYVEQVHIPLKRMFLGRVKREIPLNDSLFGKVFKSQRTAILDEIQSTAKLNTAEFAEYIDKVRRWAKIEHNVEIPEPNKIDFDDEHFIPPFAK